ncbi:MAG: NAD(P)-dependent oxidoreductase, partial [Planctomycetota bacterium]
IRLHNVSRDSISEIWESISSADVVFHLATNYGRNAESIDGVFECNVGFAFDILKRSTNSEVPLFVAANTCFPIDYPYLRPYTLSKKQFADWGKLLSEQSGTRFIDFALQHPYGPHDGTGKFVPWLMQKCLTNAATIDLTSGEQRKDFVFVADVVDALFLLGQTIEKLPVGLTRMECGSGVATCVREFVTRVHSIAQSKSTLNFGAMEGRPGEPAVSVASIDRLQQLGWIPSTQIDDGIRLTLNSMRESAR